MRKINEYLGQQGNLIPVVYNHNRSVNTVTLWDWEEIQKGFLAHGAQQSFGMISDM